MELFLIEIRSENWTQSLAWYRDVLRLAVSLIDEEHRYALLEAGLVRIALRAGMPPTDRSACRLTFRVDDVELERLRLVDLGVAAGEIISNSGEGFREFRVFDPEGTPITVFAWV